MKRLYSILTILIVASFVLAGCAAPPPAAPPAEKVEVTRVVEVEKVVEATRIVEVEKIVEVAAAAPEPAPIQPVAGIDASPYLTLHAVPVDVMPEIDGSAADEAWAQAKDLKVGVMNMKAVYNDEQIAFLMTWWDRDLSINARGTWNWDKDKQEWWRTGWEEGTWDSFKGYREPEWVNLAFDMTSVVGTEGCFAFCHEYPPGSGKFHHNTAGTGQHVDNWGFLGKHGYGPLSYEDLGWVAGGRGVIQTGDVVIDPTAKYDQHQILAGNITFLGWAEDKIIVPLDDPDYPQTDRPADVYCINCHEDMGIIDWTKTGNTTYGDDGDIPYFENWDETYSRPLYMETAPVDFADAMVITQDEIDAGEAVAVADLTPAQISEYWANYEKVDGVLSHLVLTTPSGSQADVLVGANWTNGKWTVEMIRARDTGYSDDVQFTDMERVYDFGISLWNHSDLLAPLMRFLPGKMVFDLKEDTR